MEHHGNKLGAKPSVRATAASMVGAGLLLISAATHAACSITGPTQPNSGPHGSNYANTGYTRTAFTSEGATNYIFQPSPLPANPLPVVAFLHGYSFIASGALDQNIGQVIHLARKGYIVVWPQFQPSTFTLPSTFESRAAGQIKAGLAYLAANPATMAQAARHADGSIKFGLAGYSVGGATAINLAANYLANGIPRPRALATIEANNGGGTTTPMRNASTIPADANVLMLMAEGDDANTLKTSSDAWNQIPQIPASNKQWIGVYSDAHPNCTDENLVADHGWPLASAKNLDALDYFGGYKWVTALFNYTFNGSDYDYWRGNGISQNAMGTWSDGIEIRQAVGSQTAFWPNH